MLKYTCLLFSVLASSAAGLRAADSLDTWTKCPSGVPQNLYAVAYGAGHYVCSGQGGVLLVSSNGLDWQSVPSGVSTTVFGLAYGDGSFVAVGAGGMILRSESTMDWEVQPSPTTNQLNGIAWCGGLS